MQKISIITINYNNAAGLQQTMQSVLQQDYASIEYIVIDGGSTDGSIEIVNRHQHKLAYFISEPDQGIYNAMNKGIVKATGDYILFLNSGDYLLNNQVLSRVVQTAMPDIDIIYANLQTAKGEIVYPAKPDFYFMFVDSIGHIASFIKRTMFEQHGLYNEQNKIVSDWEFFVHLLFREKATTQHLNFAITFYDLNGMSNNPKNAKAQLKERAAVLLPYFEDHYGELLNQFSKMQNELNLYKNSRAIGLLQRLMNSSLYKTITGKK